MNVIRKLPSTAVLEVTLEGSDVESIKYFLSNLESAQDLADQFGSYSNCQRVYLLLQKIVEKCK